MTLDVVVAGVGGQGVVTLAGVLARAAVLEGYDAHFTAQSGLAQVGSPVLAHVRVGTPAGPSPKIPRGRAGFVVGLERLEAMKLASFLSPSGQALLSDEAVRPYEARFRRDRYPTRRQAEERFGAGRVFWVPAPDLARPHGPPPLVSAVMLGALAGMSRVVERDNLVLALRAAVPALADAEAEAFFEGYRYVTGLDE
ncbi:MAG: 2-oxoacid:acceptor oxidoreductase family protein [Deferrisomatales bacterium]|nr:2-oxoacid:acceptor oxidoreductase family protein [Deferrisomatales bacterium]